MLGAALSALSSPFRLCRGWERSKPVLNVQSTQPNKNIAKQFETDARAEDHLQQLSSIAFPSPHVPPLMMTRGSVKRLRQLAQEARPRFPCLVCIDRWECKKTFTLHRSESCPGIAASDTWTAPSLVKPARARCPRLASRPPNPQASDIPGKPTRRTATACWSGSSPRAVAKSRPPSICQCGVCSGRSGRVIGRQIGTCQSRRTYQITSGTEVRTLSSETFQLRILAFGGSAVHCG